MTTTRLRDGSETSDVHLDRLIHFDERSRAYDAAVLVPNEVRNKTWALRVRNDQGREGACVGFGTGHRLAAAPIEVSKVNYDFSMRLYQEAKLLDPWEGENYEGTSVLAGIQAAQARGHIESYYWCFDIETMMKAVANEGPVLVGTWWKDSMWDLSSDGALDCSGTNAGGHCYIVRGIRKIKGVWYFIISNSWGRDWGTNGDALIRVEDYERYLMPDGEQAVLTEKRLAPPKPSPAPRPAASRPIHGRTRHWGGPFIVGG